MRPRRAFDLPECTLRSGMEVRPPRFEVCNAGALYSDQQAAVHGAWRADVVASRAFHSAGRAPVAGTDERVRRRFRAAGPKAQMGARPPSRFPHGLGSPPAPLPDGSSAAFGPTGPFSAEVTDRSSPFIDSWSLPLTEPPLALILLHNKPGSWPVKEHAG